MKYSVIAKPAAERQIRKLPKAIQASVINAARGLAANPRPPGCVKMAGSGDIYRIRAGDYRVLYQVLDAELLVLVVRVGHRREVYR